ncbi:MAG: futalosine hydrolase [Ferruginibacter sp.]|nr:futalosine hydrolase [Ferruginibacter sp.]
MEILVVAATEMEIAPFLGENKTTDILITGVGAPACMYALTKRLQQKKYDFVVQAGIAGTFKNSYPPGETFIVKKDVFADLGIYESGSFFTLIEKGFSQKNELPYKNGWLNNEMEESFSLATAIAITVNTVTDKFEQTELFIKKFDPDIETMEGAAFHYVCINEGVRFLQLRSISNFVGERIKSNWKMKQSIQNLNHYLLKIVAELVTRHS